MSNNKQSSVEQLEFDLKLWFDIMKIYFPTEIQNSINRSKAMHKEEMDKVAGDFWNEGASYVSDGQRKYNSFDDYYNETFGGHNDKVDL